MKTLQYRKIDAFTSKNSTGNPAACIYLEDDQVLTDEEMLSIAKQHKGFVSEVIYCKNRRDSSFELVYFSSECEVPFCGHGTIACMYEVLKDKLAQKEVIVHTRGKGSLTVYNHIEEQNAVYISAPQPIYSDCSVSTEMILGANPIDFIDAGNRTLIVPIKTLDETISLFPNEQVLKEFSLTNGIDVILIFCMETKDKNHFAHTRVFAAKYGYLEDPATGSANSAFGYYLLKNGLWDGGMITLEQGGNDRIFNAVNLFYKNERIHFGGSATTKIKGVYYL
jgi:PhzF family phenazine biosynthesis protein